MKETPNMKKLNLSLAILALVAISVNAETVTSGIVGYQTSTIPGKTTGASFFAFVPNNLSKPAIHTGSASAVGSLVTLSGAALTGTLGPVSGVPTHYLLVNSGTGAGNAADITAFTGGSVTTSDDLSASITAETTVSIIPHQKLTDILGNASTVAITGAASVSLADNVYLTDSTGTLKIYYYKTGIGAGWKTSSGADASATIIYPQEAIMVARKQSSPVSVVTLGNVANQNIKTTITQNFNGIASGVPMAMPLSALQSTIAGGTGVSGADNVYTVNPTTGALEIFYYKTGIGAGWKTSAGASADANKDISNGFLVKRRSSTTVILSQSKTW